MSLEDDLAIATILAEAGNQGAEGMLAVGEVIRNRMKRKYSSDGTVIGTILRSKQFSCWNDDSTNRKLMVERLNRVSSNTYNMIARDSWLNSSITNLSLGSVLYHTIWVSPNWSKNSHVFKKIQIKDHIFYDEVEF